MKQCVINCGTIVNNELYIYIYNMRMIRITILENLKTQVFIFHLDFL